MAVNLLNPGCGGDDCYPCDSCAIEWTFFDCRLYWKVVTPPEAEYVVHITGPGSYDESFTNQTTGVIDAPSTGTWTATLDDGAGCDITITECEPTLGCCVKTRGVHGVISGAPGYSFVPATVVHDPGYKYGLTGLEVYDYSDLNVSWYRLLEMIDPAVKTDEVCYDRVVLGRVLIGTAYHRVYAVGSATPPSYKIFDYATKPIASLTEADAMLIEYSLVDLEADLYLEFFSDVYSGFRVRIVAKITASTVTVVGTPWGGTPTAPAVDDEIIVVAGTGSTFLEGLCAPYSGGRVFHSLRDFNMGSVSYDAWPEFDL